MQPSYTGRFLSVASFSSVLMLMIAGAGALVPSGAALLATADVDDDRGSGRISPSVGLLLTHASETADPGYRGSGRVDPHTPSVDTHLGTLDWRGSGRIGQDGDRV